MGHIKSHIGAKGVSEGGGVTAFAGQERSEKLLVTLGRPAVGFST